MTIPGFLVTEQVVTKNGEGPAVELPPGAALLEVTLGILDVVEQESLDVGIYGSPDGTTWAPKPFAVFPQKFYTGPTQILADLSKTPEIRYIRAQWKVNRWGNWPGAGPMFRFFIHAAPAEG